MTKTNESRVIIVDSIMGSGKTTWAINELINDNLDKSILYIAPYLNECNRIINAATERKMVEPLNRGGGKLENIIELLEYQSDIASTHELFRRFDERCMDLIDDYTLILDETITAVEQYEIKHLDDFKYLQQNGDIEILPGGEIRWTGSDELDTRFNEIRNLAKNDCLFRVDKKYYLWTFPHEIFEKFSKIYVMTYMFENSIMKSYFDLFGIEYTKASIALVDGKYRLVEYYEPDLTEYQKRINVYSGRLNNNINQKRTALSKSWFNKNKDDRKKLQKNLNSYIRYVCKGKCNEVMWTTYKDFRKNLTGKGYGGAFTSCNVRSTNDYADATFLAYCLNWFENPEMRKFFRQRGIEIDEDGTALSTIVQWIWRSNIRVPDSDKQINVYIPSNRMRELFLAWLWNGNVPELQEIA